VITTTGNQQVTNTRIRTVLNRLARDSATDLVALKQKATCATDHTLLQPLSLAPGLVLCPIKLRTPKVSGDTSTGYINFHAVISVTSSHNKPYQSLIKLTGGTELFALWKASTVKRHFQDARLALSYTTHSPEIPPELALISHKFMEALYALLSIHTLRSPTHNRHHPAVINHIRRS
jgi:hypothetical protein